MSCRRQLPAVIKPALDVDVSDQPRTTTGEQEDARRWVGSTIFCGRCGSEIRGLLLAQHHCRAKLTKR